MTERSTNFEKGESGNVLKQGTNLNITVDGNPKYIIGRLFKDTPHGMQMIQIEQSGSRQNPSLNTITFEMKQRQIGEIVPLTLGKYRVSNYAYFSGEGGKRWEDDFEIIPA